MLRGELLVQGTIIPRSRSMRRMLVPSKGTYPGVDSVEVVSLLVAQTTVCLQDEVPLLEILAMFLVDLLPVVADRIDAPPLAVSHRTSLELHKRLEFLLVAL